MLTHLSKWGNSLGIRVPRMLVEQMGISIDTPVEITVKNNCLLVQKIHSLDALLAKVTPDNIHAEIATGRAFGQEIW